MSDWYVLDGKNPVRCDDIEAEHFLRSPKKQVSDTIIGNIRVSTIFLCLDHSRTPEDEALLFETMIFGGEHDGYQERCSTWEQAEAQHAKAIRLVGKDTVTK